MLQVQRRDGEWIDAHPIPNTVLINIADMMQRWTADRLISTVKYSRLVKNKSKKLSSLQCLLRTTSANSQKTANIIKDDITLPHIAKMSLCCEVISSFVIFAVLHLRVSGCRP